MNKEKVINSLQNIIEELKEEKKKNKRWIPADYEIFYFINLVGAVDVIYGLDSYNTFIRTWLISQRNCFKTKEEAEKYKRYLEIEAKILDIRDEFGCYFFCEVYVDGNFHTICFDRLGKGLEFYLNYERGL